MDRAQIEAIKKAIVAFTKEATKSPEAARAVLVKEGIYLVNGELSPNYRIPEQETS